MNAVKKKSDEAIFRYLEKIEDDHDQHYAIKFHLSKLLKKNKNDFQIQIALNILDDLIKQVKGTRFLVDNKDLITVFKSNNREFVEKVIYQLRYLFVDDPLAFKKHNISNPSFCHVYVLSFHWQQFIDLCHNDFKAEGGVFNLNNKLSQQDKAIADKYKSKIANFISIENGLSTLNIKQLIRKKTIALINKEKVVKPIFSELGINISHVKDMLKYDFSNKLLIKYMVDRIDSEVFKFVAQHVNQYIVGSTNFNLNIDTILSDEFIRFHEELKSHTAASIVIDLDIADIFFDIGSFYFAVDILKQLEYKVCIDGIDSYAISHIKRDTLKADLIKIRWDPDNFDVIEFDKMKNFVAKNNPTRVIMTNCIDEEAINHGKKMGIFLFQGWWVDKQLAYKNSIVNFIK